MDPETFVRLECMFRSMYKEAHVQEYKKVEFKDGSSAFVDGAKMSFLSVPCPLYGSVACVEIKKSSVHGNGVFATRDLMPGTCFTFYLGDIVEYYPDRNRTKIHRKTSKCSARASTLMKIAPDPDAALFAIRQNALQVDEYTTITGHPECKDDIWNAGHFVNDRFKPDGKLITMDIYLQLSRAKANCKYYVMANGLHVALITTKHVTQGEELFVTYGAEYWDSFLC